MTNCEFLPLFRNVDFTQCCHCKYFKKSTDRLECGKHRLFHNKPMLHKRGKIPMTEQKNEFVVYNTHNPKLFTVLHIRDGQTLTAEQFEIIEKVCRNGPFLGFFNQPDDGQIYRIRGPYNGLKQFFIIDRTGMQIHQADQTVNELKAKIAEMKESF
jgi:hypothetical protein